MVSVAGLCEEYIVREDGVRFALAFEHERTSGAEAELDASLVGVFGERLPVRAVFCEADGGDAFKPVIFRRENELFACYVRLIR